MPARNEEQHIAAALRSIAALEYDNLEVLVVDDRSTDQTAALVEEVIRAHADARIRILKAPSEPPEGWVGKTFAVDYAIKKSSGEIILVCDADAVHTPQSLHNVVSYFQEHRLDLLSLLPHFDIRSWTEYPLLFQTFLLYTSSGIARSLGSRQSFGMGTYFMFTRDFYNRSGGWSAHREYPESLPLINYCIRNGGAFPFLHDRSLVTARMHDGAAKTFWGLVRNSNFSLLQPLPLAIFVSYMALFAAALKYTLVGNPLGLIILVVMIGLFVAHLARSGYSIRVIIVASALSPIMPLYLLAVAVTALARHLFGISMSWRGRRLRPQ